MKGKLKSFFAAIGYLFVTFGIQLIVSMIGGILVGVIYAIKNMMKYLQMLQMLMI